MLSSLSRIRWLIVTADERRWWQCFVDWWRQRRRPEVWRHQACTCEMIQCAVRSWRIRVSWEHRLLNELLTSSMLLLLLALCPVGVAFITICAHLLQVQIMKQIMKLFLDILVQWNTEMLCRWLVYRKNRHHYLLLYCINTNIELCCFRSWRWRSKFSSSVYNSCLPVPRWANQWRKVWKYVVFHTILQRTLCLKEGPTVFAHTLAIFWRILIHIGLPHK